MSTRDVITTNASIGRRRESRLRLRLDARMITLDGTARAVLADLSEHGARLAGPAMALRPGMEAVLQWAGQEAFGQVVWASEHQCGIHFYDPLTRAQIFAARQMDDVNHMPADAEMIRQTARAFVQGKARL